VQIQDISETDHFIYKFIDQSSVKSYEFSVPSWAKSPLTVEAVLKYRKFNKRYSTWALDSAEIEIPVVDMARDSLTIPLKKRLKTSSVENSD
jgi:hypothetical protein